MELLRRLFGPRRHPRPEPTPEDLAGVDVDRMVATARERGDRRSEDEVLAALLIGADLTADRHPDDDLRRRASAASVVVLRRLVERVGEDEAARLLSTSAGPVDQHGRTARRRG